MSKVAIVGAGPIGLYLAYQLKKAGIQDIVVYDPRANEYTRPGHIGPSVLEKLEKKLNLPLDAYQWGEKTIQLEDSAIHIKDIERILLIETKKLKIPIEKKSFIRFHTENTQKSIVVLNSNHQEETVECDFVFDCTGSNRAVIHKVNQMITPAPFSIKPIDPSPRITNYFIAYVKMNTIDYEKIQLANHYEKVILENYSGFEYTKAIETLRGFGWKEFAFPFCYGAKFKTNKVCLYLECPHDLPNEQYDHWVQTVININTECHDILFEKIMTSKKPFKKPTFHSFQVFPAELQQTQFAFDGLPHVIAMGDSQIEPHFFLAHGIKDGLKRVNLLIKHLEVLNGSIAYFDGAEYFSNIQPQMIEHKKAITEYYNSKQTAFNAALTLAKNHYLQAIEQSNNTTEKQQLTNTLKEIQARCDILEAKHQLHQIELKLNQKTTRHFIQNQLDEVHLHLLNASLILEKSYIDTELTQATFQLSSMLFKTVGNQYFSAGDTINALACYQKALKIQDAPYLLEKDEALKLNLISNSIIGYKKLKEHTKAIWLGKEALNACINDTKHDSLKIKILYHLIKSYKELIEEELKKPASNQAESLYQELVNVHSKHVDLIKNDKNTECCQLINADINTIKLCFKNTTDFGFFKHPPNTPLNADNKSEAILLNSSFPLNFIGSAIQYE